MLSKFFNLSFILSSFTCFAGINVSNQLNESGSQDLPEWVKFFAPIVSGLLGQLMNHIFERKERKRKEKQETAKEV